MHVLNLSSHGYVDDITMIDILSLQHWVELSANAKLKLLSQTLVTKQIGEAVGLYVEWLWQHGPFQGKS